LHFSKSVPLLNSRENVDPAKKLDGIDTETGLAGHRDVPAGGCTVLDSVVIVQELPCVGFTDQICICNAADDFETAGLVLPVGRIEFADGLDDVATDGSLTRCS